MSDVPPWIFTVVVFVGIGYIVYRAIANTFGGRGKVSGAGEFVCPQCGTRGEPKRRTKGSTLVELVLWLCFIIPGLIYSLWRVSSRENVCPVCGNAAMIPVNTPRGQTLISGQKS